MTGEQEALVIGNLGLAQYFATPYARVLGREDAFSVACVGLVQAAISFNGEGTFDGWARVRINGALKDEVRRQTPGTRYQEDRPSVDSLDAISEWACGAIRDGDPLPDEQAEVSESKRRVIAAVKTLTERDATIIERRYSDEIPGAVIGRQLGISEGRVNQLNHRALKTLRPLLADLGG